MGISDHSLTSLKLFSALSAEELRTLASVMQPASYLPDEQIFAQGDKAWCCYVILDGSVRIVGAGNDAATRTFAVLEAGELFGEVALIDGGRRSAGCIAGPDGAELARLARPEFDLIFEAGNRFAFKLMDLIASQLTHRLEQAATKLRAMALAER